MEAERIFAPPGGYIRDWVKRAGESEGIAFPRRGPGAAPRLCLDPIRWKVWALWEARGWIGAKIRSQPERGSGQFRARMAQERRSGYELGGGWILYENGL